MSVVDTSIFIDVLRGRPEAVDLLRAELGRGSLHASEITRLEVLSGMRESERTQTDALLDIFVWHEVDRTVAELAGDLGRRWLRSHRGIDSADLGIAATALNLGLPLITRNIKHFPMFADLEAPY